MFLVRILLLFSLALALPIANEGTYGYQNADINDHVERPLHAKDHPKKYKPTKPRKG
jgi:hypothetical protein